ncbi:MAG: DUF3035 domain-containing protein [Candidatus Symbiobacter sp.]|nr:DUF3035 domain-containing protein [Candidatus Symbiobacter sp.]
MLPLCLIFSLVLLSGCSQSARRWLGFERTPPDENLIKTNPPLILPPDYHLRPPVNAGEARPAADKDAGKTANDTRDILLKSGNKPDNSKGN